MNLPLILFAFASISFCIYDESCGTSNDVDDQIDDITLSPDSKQELEKYSDCTYNLEDVFKERKRKYHRQMLQRNREFSATLQDKDEQLLSTQFLCALNTAKADIHAVIKHEHIFGAVVKTKSEESLWSFTSLPFDTRRVLRNYDGVIEDRISFYEDRFRNLYFRLKDPKYDAKKDPFMALLRDGIRREYAGQDDIDELYMNFAATITRDYTFLCESHHEILKVLQLLGNSPNDDILHHLFKINEQWYMDSKHIKNINILRKAFYLAFDKVDVPEIRGYPCQNKIGVDIQLPLYEKCGRVRTITETGTPAMINT